MGQRGEDGLERREHAPFQTITHGSQRRNFGWHCHSTSKPLAWTNQYFAQEKTAFNSFSLCEHLFEVLLFLKPIAKRKCHDGNRLDGQFFAALAAAALKNIAAGLRFGALEETMFPAALLLFGLIAGCERHVRKRYDNTILCFEIVV